MIYLGVPTINNVGYLQQMLSSIRCKEDHKVLIIDNYSLSETRDWVANSGYENILNPENYGVAKAWNQILGWGLSHDDCEAIFILNNDIVLHPDAFDNMIQGLREEDREFITGVEIDSNPMALEHFSPCDAEYRFIPNVHFSCFGLTPKTIKRVGFFDEGFKLAYFEDNDYHHRMIQEGIISSCDRWAAFTHYGSRSTREGGVKHEPYFSDNKDYFKRKWGFVP